MSEHHHEMPADCKLINLHNCEVAFQKWGKQRPTLEEIRRELFRGIRSIQYFSTSLCTAIRKIIAIVLAEQLKVGDDNKM